MPWLYNESGKGWKFKEGGFVDPTSTGTLGLAMDILGDPNTIYSGGAGLFRRGITSMKGLTKSGKKIATETAERYEKRLAAEILQGNIREGLVEAAKILEEVLERVA